MSKRKVNPQLQSNENTLLKSKVTEFILSQPEFGHSLKVLVDQIKEQAALAENEATIAHHFEILLYAFLKEQLNIQFLPKKEDHIDSLRHTANGRIDSRLGALIIEYKHRTKLRNLPSQQSATSQICDYMYSLHRQQNHEVIGFITDGTQAKFLILSEIGDLTQTNFEDLSSIHLERLIRSIVLLEKTALTPENLVKDFCSANGVASQLSITLFNALKNHITGRSQMLFNEWKALFKLAHDDKSKQKAIQERREALAKALNISICENDNETEYMALYAIQTAYAIIVKIIAYKVITSVRSQQYIMDFSELSNSDLATTRTHLYRLEEGAIFRDMGLGNLLEGDFFAWYCTDKQWSDDIAVSVKNVFKVLTQYEDHKMFGTEHIKIQDLFKDLFMQIIPDKVRHSLGEFYTPPWLADNLVTRSIELANTKGWKGLDPCCGSGTFITVMMRQVLKEVEGKSRKIKLHEVLNRVKGIDLNPLAVLTARINYFINISHLISDEDEFEIPIYLGDASYVPQRVKLGKVECLQYQISTLKGVISITLPVSATRNPHTFSKTMTLIETHIKNQDPDSIAYAILELIKKSDITNEVKEAINDLAKQLVDLEKNDWNGIWARIITNFLTTANIGQFQVLAGNPPWIDWKNLPANYRERIKTLCVNRKLFSGDSITGGINLNICALIANVAAENWLSKDGILAFLMPENMIFQQSYEGFRKFPLRDGSRLYFQEFYDWTKAGNPFYPVQHRFLTFFISSKVIDYQKGIPVTQFIRKTGKGLSNKAIYHQRNTIKFSDVKDLFEIVEKKAIVPNKSNTIFAYTQNSSDISNFAKITGVSSYIGRQGIEFYPQELYLLSPVIKRARRGMAFFINSQHTKSKHRISSNEKLLETKFLRPLIKGVDIQRFHITDPEFYVPFLYDPSEGGGRKPITHADLAKQCPNLMRYLNDNKQLLVSQTQYNGKIIGEKNNTEFYAVARVGQYSHATCHVVFRDNTKHCAAVAKAIVTPWGDTKYPLFQKHAVSICERPSGGFITEDEAHYICAILNAPIVERYISQSSDGRSRKIRPLIQIPEYDKNNPKHLKLRDLSIEAHNNHNDPISMNIIDNQLDYAYSQLFN